MPTVGYRPLDCETLASLGAAAPFMPCGDVDIYMVMFAITCLMRV